MVSHKLHFNVCKNFSNLKCSKLICSEIPEELPPSGHASDDSDSDLEEAIEDDSIDDYADDFEEYDSDEVSKQDLRLNLGIWSPHYYDHPTITVTLV